MTVAELVEFLLKQDQTKQVVLWDFEWECYDAVRDAKVTEDGDVGLI